MHPNSDSTDKQLAIAYPLVRIRELEATLWRPRRSEAKQAKLKGGRLIKELAAVGLSAVYK